LALLFGLFLRGFDGDKMSFLSPPTMEAPAPPPPPPNPPQMASASTAAASSAARAAAAAAAGDVPGFAGTVKTGPMGNAFTKPNVAGKALFGS